MSKNDKALDTILTSVNLSSKDVVNVTKDNGQVVITCATVAQNAACSIVPKLSFSSEES